MGMVDKLHEFKSPGFDRGAALVQPQELHRIRDPSRPNGLPHLAEAPALQTLNQAVSGNRLGTGFKERGKSLHRGRGFLSDRRREITGCHEHCPRLASSAELVCKLTGAG